jgi:MFS family permease
MPTTNTTTSSSGSQSELKVKAEIRAANFAHLYGDIFWFGIAFGSTLSFLSIFATRLGAAGWQIGLLSAGPALINVLFTLPAGRWLEKRSLGPAVTQAAFWHRLGYFLLIPLPLLLPASLQVWAILFLILLMAIPATALAVGFNALLAATVPVANRSRVVGWRNALLAGMIMISFIFSGWLLDQLSFEWGYATVFTLGALGAGMSTYHLSRIRVPSVPEFQVRPLGDRAQPGRVTGFSGGAPMKMAIGPRLWLQWRSGLFDSLKRISRRYHWVMLAFFLFHFTQMFPVPLFPLFWVREAQLSDGQIGWINALFYLSMLGAAPLLEPLAKRLGNRWLNTIGALLLAIYPLLTALAQGMPLLLVASLTGGATWAILSGGLSNRLLESVPEDNRPVHLALYNMALNVAVLSGTLLSPSVANIIGLRETLILAFVLRLISSLALHRWG